MGDLPLKIEPHVGACPYCLKSVGIIGNWLARLFGTQMHGCNFSNVDHS
jgi:hypothetical protein